MKMLRFLLSAAMLVTLLAGIQMTAFAALVSPADDEVSQIARENEVSRIAQEADASQIARENETSLPGTARAAAEASLPDEGVSRLHDIAPISANPDTGTNNIVVPAVVALLAASTAAIALSSKKKK